MGRCLREGWRTAPPNAASGQAPAATCSACEWRGPANLASPQGGAMSPNQPTAHGPGSARPAAHGARPRLCMERDAQHRGQALLADTPGAECHRAGQGKAHGQQFHNTGITSTTFPARGWGLGPSPDCPPSPCERLGGARPGQHGGRRKTQLWQVGGSWGHSPL